MPRIPVACAVLVRQRVGGWGTVTEDVGARGCRIALPRPLAPGALVQLRFDRGDGGALDAVGQVAWARGPHRAAAGVTFVAAPCDAVGATPRDWIDALLAAQLRHALATWPPGDGVLEQVGAVVVRLGVPPIGPLEPATLELARLAQAGVALADACRSPESARVLVALLERGIVSVSRAPSDPAGWKRALAIGGPPDPDAWAERASGHVTAADRGGRGTKR